MINSINIQIRETNTDDFDSIMTVEKQAFGYDKEAQLVADLLADKTAEPMVSLLAFYKGEAVGHILFTRAYFDGQGALQMMHILAPLESEQRNHWLCLVFVLGHKEYYPEYGFIPDAARLGYPAPYPILEQFSDYWMVQAISPKGFDVDKGKIRCSDELNKPEHWRDDESDR